MEPLSRSDSAHSYQVTHPLTAEEQAEKEKREAILQIVKEAQDLRDNILKMPAAIQKYMFCHMSTEYLIELSKITNPDTEHLASIASSVRVFAVNEFNEKFNKEALLAENKKALLQVENKATTADILLSVELKDVEEELAPYIINHKDSQFVDAEATEARLKSLQEAARGLLLQKPNTYQYPFIVNVFRTHFKEEYEAGLQRIYNIYKLHLSDLNDALKKNKDFMLIAIKRNIYALQHAHEDLKKDREFVLAAVRQKGLALQFAHEDLKKDIEIVLAAFTDDRGALQCVHEDLKKDRKFILAAVRQKGRALEFVNEDFKSDREIVVAAVSQHGHALKFVHEDFKKDREIVLAAVSQHGDALEFAYKDLKKDRKIVFAAVNQEGSALKYAHEDLKKDRKFVLSLVMQKGEALQYAHEDRKGDRKIVLAAVKNDGHALSYAHGEFKKDKAIVLAAVMQNGHALRYAHEDFKKYKAIVFAALKNDTMAREYAHEDLKNDPDFKKEVDEIFMEEALTFVYNERLKKEKG